MQDRDEEDRVYEETGTAVRKQLNDVVLRIPIKRLQYGPPLAVPSGATAAQAIKAMQDAGVGCCLVTKPDGSVAGIFTERDVLRKIVGKGASAAEARVDQYMTANPDRLSLDDTVGFAFNKMAVGGFRHVPLVDAKGMAVGTLSVRTILRFLAEHFPEDVINLPPTSDAARGRDGG